MTRTWMALSAACGILCTTAVAQSRTPNAEAGEVPRLLSQTGLYAAGGGLVIAPGNRPFSPQYPLWTDGAVKRRWVHVPAGRSIRVDDADAWEFPVGTRFWKEFSFGGRKVETRLLWRVTANRWSFASYVWNENQTDAVLAPPEGVPAVAEIRGGRRHSVPAEVECRACHDTTQTNALGFTALQLSPDRDPLAVHAEPLPPGAVTLATLVRENRLAGAQVSALAATAPAIRAENPATRAVLGYLSTNCGSCHNLKSSLAGLGVDFSQRAAGPMWTDAEAARRFSRVTQWQLPHNDEGTRLVTAGAPEESALVYRMRSRRPSTQMPPLGTVVPDQDGLELLTTWVNGLPRH